MIDFVIKKRISAFRLDLSLRTEADVIGITGVSGSGKTTLLNCLAGLIRPDSGHIIVGDECLFHSSKLDIPVHQRQVAVVFQDNRLFPHMSVEGNLNFALKHSKSEDKTFTIAEIAELVEITHLLKRSVRNLSGGELKRVAIGRAILSHPKLLLMDEPFAGMDGDLSWRILGILEQIRYKLKIPMILVSHTLDEIQNLCDMLVIMREGQIKAAGKISDILASKNAMQLLHALDYSNRIDGRVKNVDRELGFVNVQVSPALTFRAPIADVKEGDSISYTLRTKDISISNAPIPNISIQNQLPCKITKVVIAETGVICVLDCGVELLAEVTLGTAKKLKLEDGRIAWALFKTQALTPHLYRKLTLCK
ncbi:MAG: molybdenum ABC transporter ATP-binding protein [Sedimentisphaeraceae bacterium JB056]